MTMNTEPHREDATPRIGDFGHFTPKAFVADSEIAQTKIARKQLSPSTSNVFATKCTAQWAVGKLLPFDDSPSSPAGAGNLVHLAFERFYALTPEERTSEALASEINKVAASVSDGDLATMKYLSAMYRELAWGLFEIEDPSTVDVHHVEEELFAEIDGVPCQGKIDRTDIVEGKLVIRDYKTSRKLPKPQYDDYDHAMRTYAMLYEQVYGQRPVEAWLYYTKLGVAKKVDLSDRKLKATRRRITRSWDAHGKQVIESSTFPTTVSPLCGWCPLVNLCPAAADAGKKVAPAANMTPHAVEDHNLADPTEVLAEAAVGKESSMGATVQPLTFGSAGHPDGDRSQRKRSKTPQRDTGQEDPPMRIDETSPYEKYTRDGDMNPSSWAVNNLFVLRSAAMEAVVAADAEEVTDKNADLSELGQHVFQEVALTVAGAQRDWVGVGPDTQAASFNRLTHVAVGFLRERLCDFDNEDAFNEYLDEMSDVMLSAVDSVFEVFNLIDDEAEAMADADGEDHDQRGPWKKSAA